MPGEYTFSTAAAELMEVISGEAEVLIGGTSEWKKVVGGESFEVPADSSFTIKVKQVMDYCCSFLG